VREAESGGRESPPRLPAGYRFGAYEIVRHIGDGGMGAVYEATRSDGTFTKSVAIKVLHGGLHSAEIVRRFHGERQVLGSLTHANIATLLDAGTTESGRPYFVMEYVDGVPIDTYCEARALSLDQRLHLFLDICAAVEHAHSHLVIHRDLKPDNVLVRRDGEVKLLDFGIAKVLRPGPDADAPHTTMFRPMTVRYASPEQLRGDAVTTAADIYSLGVLLFLLVTGRSPYSVEGASAADIERAVCELAPLRPSGIARTAALPWARDLAGDLDAIILMALRKEPERRYRGVDQFAGDIRRYRARLPIAARPDTTRYRVRKFASRNRLASAAAAIAVVGLIAGIATTTWMARVARREAAVAVAEREKARLETNRVQRLNEFLTNVLALPDANWYSPGAGSRYDMTVADLLQQAGQRIDVELQTYPDLAADLHHTLGNTYRSRAMYQDAQRHFAAALKLRQATFGPAHAKVAESLYFLGAAEYWLGREAHGMTLYKQAIDIERALPPGAARNLPYLLSDLSGALRQHGDLANAEQAARESVAIMTRDFGADDPRTIFPAQNLVSLLMDRGEFTEARRLCERILVMARQHPQMRAVPAALYALAGVEAHEGRFPLAEALTREAIDMGVRTVGPDSVEVAHWLGSLASFLRGQGKDAEAFDAARRALAIQEMRFGRGDHRISGTLTELGQSADKLGRTAEAERHLREAIRVTSRSGTPALCSGGQAKWNLSLFLSAHHRQQEIGRLMDEAVADIAAGCGSGGRMHRAAMEAARHMR
jgi:tetratricopeptide (TPR) repeat protein